jgi:hypothetical protein
MIGIKNRVEIVTSQVSIPTSADLVGGRSGAEPFDSWCCLVCERSHPEEGIYPLY